MKLTEIISALQPVEVTGAADVDVKSICIDSRKVEAGSLFVAVKGTQVDGHAYIEKAIEAGAVAVVHSEPVAENLCEKATFVRVADTEAASGIAATTFYGNPTRHLKLVGVTGTNGKTTIATVLYNQSLLIAGLPIENPTEYTDLLVSLF